MPTSQISLCFSAGSNYGSIVVGSGYSLHISLASEHYLNACEKVRLSLVMLPSVSSFAMWKFEG
jgi:hypothetical protein